MERSENARGAWVWVGVAVAVAGIWTVSACSSDPAADDPGTSSGEPSSSSGGSSGATSSSSGGSSSGSTSSSGDGGGSSSGGTATDPNLKVAFIGDTASGNDFKSVLDLIIAEKAQAVFIQGDIVYLPDFTSGPFYKAIDDRINKARPGSPATVTIPYFIAKGNHDIDWGLLAASSLKDRMGQWGVAAEHGDPTTVNYSVVFKGLKVVFVSDNETNPTRAEYVVQRFQNDDHIWKVCAWHKNQRASNVGPKNDEMGWAIYENCRNFGAIVAQGHSHTYSRSKTLTADATQTVDPACSDPFQLCVGPGKHFFFDSSLGGVETRSVDSTVAAMPHFASSYGGNFGALFMEFNVDGDPKKARGYFKTVGGTVVDPPPSSGKPYFTVTRSP